MQQNNKTIMKKIILIATILMGVITSSHAQIFTKSKANHIGQTVKEGYDEVKKAIVQKTKPSGEHTIWDIYAAPKVGLNLSDLPGIDGKMKLGVVAGAYVEVFVTKNIGIDVEMGYSRQGSSGVYNTAYTTDALGNVTTSRVGAYDYRLDYINIDYLVRWYPWTDLTWSFTTGLHMARLVSAHSKLKHGEDLNIKDDIHSGDVAIPFGVSYEWKQWQLEARYNLSFRKLATSDKAKLMMGNARNSMAEITLGYRIKVF